MYCDGPVMPLQSYKTRELLTRLAFDLTASFSAAACTAPLVMAIDKAIIQNTSGQAPLRSSLTSFGSKFLLRPHQVIFSKPFFLITLLYTGTYLAANTVDTLSSIKMNKSASTVTSGATKFLASSAANVSLCLFKDANFVKIFGPSAKTPNVPLSSLALFTLRDSLTIFASFNIPAWLGPQITSQLDSIPQANLNGQTIAQLTAPAAMQLLSTPLHLLGLDLYNRPSITICWSQRWTLIKKNWSVSVVARIGRIVPAFGVGGVVNERVRKNLMDKIKFSHP